MRPRFSYIFWLLAWLAACGLPACPVRAQGPANGIPPPEPAVDPETGVVHSQRLASGVPLGGIGTGAFQLLTDGSLARADLSAGLQSPASDLPGCFASLWTRVGDRTDARVLSLRSAYSLPVMTTLDYDGLYPLATLEFPDTALPVAVSLRAFSPLVPFDIKNSSLPVVAFIFRLKNTSPVPVEVSAALSWEHTPGVGSIVASANAQRRAEGATPGVTVVPIPDSEGFFGLRFAAPEAAGANDRPGLSRAEAPDEMTLMAYPPRKDATVTMAGWNAKETRPAWWDDFARDGNVSGSAPTGLAGKARPAGVVAVRMTLKPRDSVDIPIAISWYTPHFFTSPGVDAGPYYASVFRDAGQVARELLGNWRGLLALTQEWQARLLSSSLPRWQARRLINAVAPLTTQTVHTRDGRFAFLAPAEAPLSRPYSSAQDPMVQRLVAGSLLLDFFPQLQAQTLTQWMAVQSPTGLLPSRLDDLQVLLGPPTAPENTATPASPAPPAPPSKEQGAPRARPPAGTSNNPAGSVPPSEPDAASSQTAAPETLDEAALVHASAFVLQAAQYILWTGDRAFLYRFFPNVRRALFPTLQSANSDGLPVLASMPGGPGAASGLPSPGALTLWLAALRAGQALGEMASDPVAMQTAWIDVPGDLPGRLTNILSARRFAQACGQMFTRAAAGMEKRYWNGQFYTPERPQAPPNTALCATDQLLGPWAADLLGLGPLLPENHVVSALQALQQRNDKAPGTFGPPNRLRADGTFPPDDPGAHDCLLLASLLGQASLYLAHERAEAGEALLQRLDATRTNLQRSPWQSPLAFRADTGQADADAWSSLAQAADWPTLYALQGFAFDFDAGRLTLVPSFPGTWRNLTTPVFAPTFWGRLEFKPMAHGGVLTFRLDRLIAFATGTPSVKSGGKLVLTSLWVPGPPLAITTSGDMPAVHISVGQNPIGARIVSVGPGDLQITFDTPLALSVGDLLEVDVH